MVNVVTTRATRRCLASHGKPTDRRGSECDKPRGRLVIAVLARERDREASSPFDLYNYEAEHFHAPFLHNATKSRYLDRLA